MLIYATLGKVFKWTPENIDKLDAIMVEDLMVIVEEMYKEKPHGRR